MFPSHFLPQKALSMPAPTPSQTKRDLLGLSLPTLAAEFQALGEKPFRAKQVFAWLYKRQVRDFEQMEDLSKPLRQALSEKFMVGSLAAHRVQRSQRDGTAKY